MAAQKQSLPEIRDETPRRASDGLIAFGLVEPQLTAEFFERIRLQLPALRSGQCPEKPLGVFGDRKR